MVCTPLTRAEDAKRRKRRKGWRVNTTTTKLQRIFIAVMLVSGVALVAYSMVLSFHSA